MEATDTAGAHTNISWGNVLVRGRRCRTRAVMRVGAERVTLVGTSSPRPRADALPQAHPKLGCAVVLTAVEDLIHKFLDIHPLRLAIDPKYVLAGNFGPVDELPPTECKVEGTLPQFLNGAYIRNGPNPQFPTRGPHQFVEGDGMLHLIRISDGKAKFCSRYVQTYKYQVELAMGCPVLPNIYSGFNGLLATAARGMVMAARILTGHYHYNYALILGVANTSVAYLCNALYALEESDLLYAIKVTSEGDMKTVGKHDFNGKLLNSMTAHPKVDANTGEVFAFRYALARPFLTYFRFDSNGNKLPDINISSVYQGSIFHDFAITKNYAIFSETQLAVSPLNKILGGGPPMGANLAKVPRLGVIPRYAVEESSRYAVEESGMMWFDAPGLNMFHLINAWDEEDRNEVVIIAPNFQAIEHAIERMDLVHFSLEKITLNLDTGKITRQPFSSRSLEFSVINLHYIGKKNKYVYSAICHAKAGDPVPKVTGIIKVDVSEHNPERVVGIRIFEEGCYGGEPFFVPKNPDDPNAEEDDGCLVCYMHNGKTGKSNFLVMDAKSPNLETVAIVRLPRRVPYGFHGLFLSENDLHEQISRNKRFH